jgi:hypothetical protein
MQTGKAMQHLSKKLASIPYPDLFWKLIKKIIEKYRNNRKFEKKSKEYTAEV